jgi:hypothetical protein
MSSRCRGFSSNGCVAVYQHTVRDRGDDHEAKNDHDHDEAKKLARD